MPSHDVLIIGAGLAGQRAALAAADAGASVAIMSKVHPVRSHSNAAAGGINAALNPEDTWESHAFDTVKGSDYLGDQDAIEIMCREAPDEILHLEHLGVTFHRNEEGKLGTRAFGGASQARTYYVADITGQAIMHVLYEQLMKFSDAIARYGDGPVPPHDAGRKGVFDHRGGARRGRPAAQRQRRALHGEVRAEQDGARVARRRVARRADRDQRGPRLSRRHGGARHHGGSAQ